MWKGEIDYGFRGVGGWIGFRFVIFFFVLCFNVFFIYLIMLIFVFLFVIKKGCFKS